MHTKSNRHRSPSAKAIEDDEAIYARTEELKGRGRLMPDSALTTYFGKPAWHTYGRVNVKPAQGGLVYGDYLKSHNINPHSGANNPETI